MHNTVQDQNNSTASTVKAKDNPDSLENTLADAEVCGFLSDFFDQN